MTMNLTIYLLDGQIRRFEHVDGQMAREPLCFNLSGQMFVASLDGMAWRLKLQNIYGTLDGDSSLTTLMGVVHPMSMDLNQDSTLTCFVGLILPLQVGMAPDSTLQASIQYTGSLNSLLEAEGTALASVSLTGALDASLNPDANLDTTMIRVFWATVDINPEATLDVNVEVTLGLVTELNLDANLETLMDLIHGIIADLNGEGDLEAEVTATLSVEAELNPEGDLEGDVFLTHGVNADITPEGDLDTEATAMYSVQAELNPEGDLEVSFTAIGDEVYVFAQSAPNVIDLWTGYTTNDGWVHQGIIYDAGEAIDIATGVTLNPDGLPEIGFYRGSDYALRYLKHTGSGWTYTPSTIDDLIAIPDPLYGTRVGSTFAYDSDGNTHWASVRSDLDISEILIQSTWHHVRDTGGTVTSTIVNSWSYATQIRDIHVICFSDDSIHLIGRRAGTLVHYTNESGSWTSEDVVAIDNTTNQFTFGVASYNNAIYVPCIRSSDNYIHMLTYAHGTWVDATVAETTGSNRQVSNPYVNLNGNMEFLVKAGYWFSYEQVAGVWSSPFQVNEVATGNWDYRRVSYAPVRDRAGRWIGTTGGPISGLGMRNVTPAKLAITTSLGTITTVTQLEATFDIAVKSTYAPGFPVHALNADLTPHSWMSVGMEVIAPVTGEDTFYVFARPTTTTVRLWSWDDTNGWVDHDTLGFTTPAAYIPQDASINPAPLVGSNPRPEFSHSQTSGTNFGLNYAPYVGGGIWDDDILVYTEAGINTFSYALAFDSSGDAHFTTRAAATTRRFRYHKRTKAGTITSELLLSGSTSMTYNTVGLFPTIMVDADDKVHIICLHQQRTASQLAPIKKPSSLVQDVSSPACDAPNAIIVFLRVRVRGSLASWNISPVLILCKAREITLLIPPPQYPLTHSEPSVQSKEVVQVSCVDPLRLVHIAFRVAGVWSPKAR